MNQKEGTRNRLLSADAGRFGGKENKEGFLGMRITRRSVAATKQEEARGSADFADSYRFREEEEGKDRELDHECHELRKARDELHE
ncbi:hypothetical protein HZA56_18430 [Candidatus Poribacteria bacterium]|nr:hypothetical protein [Candidatus Poribacteria bacterium]